MKLIAHGGYSAKYPENTLESFIEASKFNPYAIEMDVVEHPHTGQLICFHPTGVSSQSGTFSRETVLEQLQSGENFPSVSELLQQIPENTKVLLDFKQPSKELFTKVIQSSGFDVSRIIIGVRDLDDFNFIKLLNSQVQTLALFSNPDLYQGYAQKGGVFFRLWEKDLTSERVESIQDLGLEVWVTPGQKATETQPRTAGEVDSRKLNWFTSIKVNAVLVNDIAFASEYVNIPHLQLSE